MTAPKPTVTQAADALRERAEAGQIGKRLLALAEVHDRFAARLSWKGNAKYAPSASAVASRQHHEQIASDLRTAAEMFGQSDRDHSATLRLSAPITVPKGGIPFTVTLSRRLDGSFDVVGGPTI